MASIHYRLSCEPKSEGEQGVVMAIPDVHGELIHRLEPRASQLPGEPVIAEQRVGDALPFRSRQPSRHKGVNFGHVGFNHHRPPGNHHHHAFHRPAHVVYGGAAGSGDGEIGAVAEHLRVGHLADDDYGVGETAGLDESRLVCQAEICQWILEQSHRKFNPQYPLHSVVDPAHRDNNQNYVVLQNVLFSVRRVSNPVNALPIRDDKPLQVHKNCSNFRLSDIANRIVLGNESFIALTLNLSLFLRKPVTRHMNAEQVLYVDHSVALVNALNRPTIPNKMLRAGSDFRPLHTKIYTRNKISPGNDFCHHLHNLVVFAVAFVATPPSRVSTYLDQNNNQESNNIKAGMRGEHDVSSTYCNARSKSVRDASGSDFKCSCSSNPLHEFWIPDVACREGWGSNLMKMSIPIVSLDTTFCFCLETKPEREQGIVVGIPHIHWELVDRLEPSSSELTCEPVVTKQEISDALAFSSRKPSRDNCIYLVNIGLHHNRAARDDDHHASDCATDIVDNAGPGFSYRKIRAVTKHLCIGKLPDNNNGIIEVVGTHKLRVGIFLVDNLCRRINRSFHRR
nr:rplT [Ipomoea batatas]